jgi:phosphocarrier protein HPr
MKQVTVTVVCKVGIHARPAAILVNEAKQFTSSVQIRNLTVEHGWVNGKSILSVLGLGIKQGHKIEIEADGPDEEQAVEHLQRLVLSDFDEKA